MEAVFLLGLVALLGVFAAVRERSEQRRAAVRVWSDEYERRLASERRGWPLE